MLTLHTKIDNTDKIDGELVLPYELREKSRQRAALSSGEEVAVLTVRGTVLRDGDCLKGDDGRDHHDDDDHRHRHRPLAQKAHAPP